MKNNSENQIVCISGQPRLLNHDNREVLSRMLNAAIDLTRIRMKFLGDWKLYPLTNQYDSTTDCKKSFANEAGQT